LKKMTTSIRATRAVASLLAAGLLPASLALFSCAPKQPVETLPPPTEPAPAAVAAPEPPPPDFGELYRRITDHVRVYDEGVGLIVAGEEVLGEERMAAASVGLMDDAGECSTHPDCDIRPFLDAYDWLLAQQDLALKQQMARLLELEKAAQEDIEREPGTSPFAAEMPELGRTASLLRGTDLGEIITLNGPVKAAIDDWLTWMRPMLMNAWQNYGYLRKTMAPVYEEAGLPEALLFAMLATETGGKVHSYSRAGAAGPLQFMRRTGRRYGLKVVDGFDMRLDPEASTRANVAYLNDQFEALNNSLEMALAAYNGGETRVQSLHRRYGDRLWDSKVYWSLPRETREYVPRILAAAWLFLHPEDYNLVFPPIDAATASLELQADIAINELAICLGQEQNPDGWFRTLRNLNPRLEPGERVEVGKTIEIPAFLVPVYEERCLEGEVLARAREVHEANYPPEPEMIVYTVRRGDTLGRIASRFRCASIGEIASINRIRPPRYVIQVGQTLKIPTCR
jgi:membrane-bound lytic murein transglycosylase D